MTKANFLYRGLMDQDEISDALLDHRTNNTNIDIFYLLQLQRNEVDQVIYLINFLSQTFSQK